MPLSRNEIKLSKEWKNVSSEKAQAKTFRDGFFDVFGRIRINSLKKRTNYYTNRYNTYWYNIIWYNIDN